MYAWSEVENKIKYIIICTVWCLEARKFLVWVLWEASGFSVWSVHVFPVWDLSLYRSKICIWSRGELADGNCPEGMSARDKTNNCSVYSSCLSFYIGDSSRAYPAYPAHPTLDLKRKQWLQSGWMDLKNNQLTSKLKIHATTTEKK